MGLLADVYPPDNLGFVMGATMMANAVGFMVGPVVGAYFYDYHGYKAPFIFCAALAILDFLCILFIAEPEKRKISAAAFSSAVDQDVDGLVVGEPTTSTIVAVERTAAAISDPKHAQEILDDGLHHHSSSNSEPSGYGSVHTSAPAPVEDPSMFEIACNWTIICCLLATFVAASVFSGNEPRLCRADKRRTHPSGFFHASSHSLILFLF